MHNKQLAISPLDGRYAHLTESLNNVVSEYALNKYRLIVEIKWVEFLGHQETITDLPRLSDTAKNYLESIITDYDTTQNTEVKNIEKQTNHDVKAIEYYIKQKLEQNTELKQLKEFVHFACTSEDINNLAYALMLSDLRNKILNEHFNRLLAQLKTFAVDYADTAMLSRTHGQSASPTTVGKEFAVFYSRINAQIKQLNNIAIEGKFNGAVGNYHAHSISYPEVKWDELSKKFVEKLGLKWNPLTTQIESHDFMAALFNHLAQTNTVLIDLCRDMWGYISLGYFKQKTLANEVGSSTMPHKVNPIDFENAEGNLGIANALLIHFAQKLPISRWQRDLSDSTVQRNIGSAFAYSLISLQSIAKGLAKCEINEQQLATDLDNNWEVLAEAIQTVMRRYKVSNPYEQLKALTRGKKITQQIFTDFINQLEIPEQAKNTLKQLTPRDYTGIASDLIKKYL